MPIWPSLGQLSALESLELGGSQITDQGLAAVRQLPTLLRLYLHDLELSDAGLQHLAGLKNLEALSMQQTQVKGPGLVHLKNLVGLQVLNLAQTGTTDADLVHLEGLTNLETLVLEGTRVTGGGLIHLKSLSRLRVLNLKACDVAAADLEHLVGIRSLKILWMKGTQVTRDEAKVVQEQDGRTGGLLLLMPSAQDSFRTEFLIPSRRKECEGQLPAGPFPVAVCHVPETQALCEVDDYAARRRWNARSVGSDRRPATPRVVRGAGFGIPAVAGLRVCRLPQ